MLDLQGQLWVAPGCQSLVILSAVVWRPLSAQDALACLMLTIPGRLWVGRFQWVVVIGNAQTSFLMLSFQDDPWYLRFQSSKLCPISILGNVDRAGRRVP